MLAAPGCADRSIVEPDLVDARLLVEFENCDELLTYAKSNASDLVQQYGNIYGYDNGFGWEGGWDDNAGDPNGSGTGDPTGGESSDSDGDSAGDSGAPQDSGGGQEGDPDYSGTNVQEVGVDEPDIIKTDGERILALAQGKLHFVDATGVTPQLRGAIDIGYDYHGAQLFLHEDRALVLLQTHVYNYGGWEGEPWPEDTGTTTGGDPGDDTGDESGETDGDPDTGDSGEPNETGGDSDPGPAPDEPGWDPEPPQNTGLDLSEHFPANAGTITRLIEIDISNPDDLRVVSNLYVSGAQVSARLIDGVARVVIRSGPTGLEFKDPWEFFNYEGEGGGGEEPGTASVTTTAGSGDVPPPEPGTSGSSSASTSAGTGEPHNQGPTFRADPQDPWQVAWDKAVEEAKLYNLAIIENSTIENWLPHYVLEDLSQGEPKLTKGLLLDCADVSRPGDYSGLSTLSVLTVNLEQALALGQSIGVMAEGETVYASKTNLYVSTTPWLPQQWESEEGRTTYIHKFSLANTERAQYIASGELRGSVRSQWSISEHEGDLRVATTDQKGWDTASRDNFVTVLRQEEDTLVQIGQVGGLGLGEEIQGVRFIGSVGYVVTFRQIDPLYTIDLHDPTNPTMLGELKIPGFSAYLHPVGEDLLLGVGYDGTDEGQLLGLQLSLFDVSDLKDPKRIHQAGLGEAFGWSEAIFDHKAFLYWGKTQLALVPTESYHWDEQTMTESYFSGALGYSIDREDGIQPVGEIQHITDNDWGWSPPIRRSMVIGDRVMTLSDLGLKTSVLGDLSDVAWLEF